LALVSNGNLSGNDIGKVADRMADVLIECTDVAKTFGQTGGSEVTALTGLNLAVTRHEFVSVLGPSGCEKSTLLRLIAGLTPPTSGRISVYGHPVTEPRDDIGIVFQKPTLLPWLNVLANVTVPIKHKYGRVSAVDRDRAAKLVDQVGLSEFQRRQSINCRVECNNAPRSPVRDEPFWALTLSRANK
jgi:NitT/TauT family transport system ATP-binding protein